MYKCVRACEHVCMCWSGWKSCTQMFVVLISFLIYEDVDARSRYLWQGLVIMGSNYLCRPDIPVAGTKVLISAPHISYEYLHSIWLISLQLPIKYYQFWTEGSPTNVIYLRVILMLLTHLLGEHREINATYALLISCIWSKQLGDSIHFKILRHRQKAIHLHTAYSN